MTTIRINLRDAEAMIEVLRNLTGAKASETYMLMRRLEKHVRYAQRREIRKEAECKNKK